MSDVVGYFGWLGAQVSDAQDRRVRIEAAGAAIHANEQTLTQAMIHGIGNLFGLADLLGVISSAVRTTRHARVWCASLLDGMEAPDLVSALR